MTGQLAPAWQVQLLGAVQAWRDGTEVDLGTLRQRTVFAVLAMHANQVVSKSELVDAVWGSSAPPKVEASVYTYVSGLRRALEPERLPGKAARMIESAGTGYSLRLDPEALDVVRFIALRDKSETLLECGDLTGAFAALDSALGLWRGQPMLGLTGVFADLQRTRLAELRLAVLERRAEATMYAGRPAEAIAQLSGLTIEHPTRESLRGLLMIALYRSGRSAEALDVYRETRATMVAELGVEPGPELRRVHDQVLADAPELLRDRFNAPAATTTRDQGEGAPVPRTLDFVGRVPELRELRDRIGDLGKGQGSVVWIEGEPGIGKSALVAEAIGRGEGHRVLWATGDELGQRWPLRLIMDCLGVTSRWDLADPLPVAIDRVVGLIEDLCTHAPLMIVLDDLHWADKSSLLVWQRLTKVTQKLPLLVVGVCRPVPRWAELDHLCALARSCGGQLMRLGPLAEEEVDQLAATMLHARPTGNLSGLAGRVAGNPLYLREVLDALVREALIEIDGGLADVAGTAWYSIPLTLTSAIGRRLDFVSDELRDRLRWASLLGSEFDLGELAVVLAEPAAKLAAAVEEAAAVGLLQESGQGFAFRHPLVRDALYLAMPLAVRNLLHRQAAEMLDKAGAPVDRVAEQLLRMSTPADRWMIEWTLANGNSVGTMSPLVAVELLYKVLTSPSASDEARRTIAGRLAGLRLLPAYLDHRGGDVGVVLPSMRERVGLDDLDAAEASAHTALARATKAGDASAIGYSLQNLWQLESVRRRHGPAMKPHVTAASSYSWLGVENKEHRGSIPVPRIRAGGA
jgi:DNA-binding SARP family transcriptional activator